MIWESADGRLTFELAAVHALGEGMTTSGKKSWWCMSYGTHIVLSEATYENLRTAWIEYKSHVDLHQRLDAANQRGT